MLYSVIKKVNIKEEKRKYSKKDQLKLYFFYILLLVSAF